MGCEYGKRCNTTDDTRASMGRHTHTHTHTHTHIHTHAKSEWRMVDAFAEWVLKCRFVFRFLATSLLSFEGI